MATKGSNLAIGTSTGRVTIITFYLDGVKTWTVYTIYLFINFDTEGRGGLMLYLVCP
jgi:hypothetical protein